jgi:hypothetical protein
MSESQKLLHEHPSDSDSEPEPERRASPLHLSPSPSSSRATSTSPAPPGSRPGFGQKRQSSFAQPRPDGAPRTPNRVRFEDVPGRNSEGGADWIELEGDDYMGANGHNGRHRVQRLPLLTGIEAPSVTVAEESFDPEDYLESARPRSGMRSAFMNMANSIMWASRIHMRSEKIADMPQRCWHHWPAIRLPQRWPRHRHRSPDRSHHRGRLDHPPHCHQLEVERHGLVSGYCAALLWKIRLGRNFAGTMAVVCVLFWNTKVMF